MNRADLITALETASGPSRELDGLVAQHIGRGKAVEPFSLGRIPAYTVDLNVVVAMVLDGDLWAVGHRGDVKPGQFLGTVMPKTRGLDTHGYAFTPAHALLIAILRASDT